MITIYKYPLKATRSEFEMPHQSDIIKCGYDPQGQLCLWAAVDTEQEMVPVTFIKIGTGWPLDDFLAKYNMSYVDSVNEDTFVWHIFRIQEKPVIKFTNACEAMAHD